MHDRPAKCFFVPAIEKVRTLNGEARKEAEAYIYGYVCHFALDTACHTYVERRKVETGVTHTEIECEFDRRLMVADGVPGRFPMDHIITDADVAERILPFYQGITVQEIREAMRSMRFYGHVLDGGTPLLRGMLKGLAGALDKSGELAGWYASGGNQKCDETFGGLAIRFEKGLNLAERLFSNMDAVLNGTAELDEIYERNFGVQEVEI